MSWSPFPLLTKVQRFLQRISRTLFSYSAIGEYPFTTPRKESQRCGSIGTIQRNQLRCGKADTFQKRVKRTGFQHKTGNIFTGSDPNSCFIVPNQIDGIIHRNNISFVLIIRWDARPLHHQSNQVDRQQMGRVVGVEEPLGDPAAPGLHISLVPLVPGVFVAPAGPPKLLLPVTEKGGGIPPPLPLWVIPPL